MFNTLFSDFFFSLSVFVSSKGSQVKKTNLVKKDTLCLFHFVRRKYIHDKENFLSMFMYMCHHKDSVLNFVKSFACRSNYLAF